MRIKEIYDKYQEAIDAVAIEQEVDISVAEDMVRSVCEVRTGRIEGDILYKGVPEDFDCEAYLADYLKE